MRHVTKSLHVSRRVEIVRRDFVVQISIFSMPRCLGSESPSMLEIKNYRNPYKYVEGGKRTGTTRKNACNRETMVKIRVAIIFIIAQVVLTKYHTSRRSANIVVEDRAIRCNRKTVTNSLSNTAKVSELVNN